MPGFAVRHLFGFLSHNMYSHIHFDIQGCRLILNMSHLLHIGHPTLLPTTTDGQVMDTMFLTNDIVTGLIAG